MTLFKAVEAAREALGHIQSEAMFQSNTITLHVNKALAALPDKPMTEEQIWNIAADAWEENKSLLEIIRALKAANCLYVKEN